MAGGGVKEVVEDDEVVAGAVGHRVEGGLVDGVGGRGGTDLIEEGCSDSGWGAYGV